MRISPDNRQFGLGLLAAVALALASWVLLLAGQLGRPHPDNLWVEQAYKLKVGAARQRQQSPRILVVAGSGAMFGIDSAQLAAAWGMPAINLGVNAGIGPYFLIDHALPLLGPGDIIIAPLEYPLYTFDGDIGYVFLSYLWSHPAILPQLPLLSVAQAVWTTPLKRVLEAYPGGSSGAPVRGLYGPPNLDANGDQLNSQLAQRNDELHAAAVAAPAEQYGAQARPGALGWGLWRAFAAAAAERGACVIFVPPPLMAKPEYHELQAERRFYRDLPDVAAAEGINYLGDPRDFLYPPEWFFDTNYHLVAEQRRHYTWALVELIGLNPGAHCARR
jgi:hypothetical protein